MTELPLYFDTHRNPDPEDLKDVADFFENLRSVRERLKKTPNHLHRFVSLGAVALAIVVPRHNPVIDSHQRSLAASHEDSQPYPHTSEMVLGMAAMTQSSTPTRERIDPSATLSLAEHTHLDGTETIHGDWVKAPVEQHLREIPTVEQSLAQALSTIDAKSKASDGALYYEDLNERSEASDSATVDNTSPETALKVSTADIAELETTLASYLNALERREDGSYDPAVLSIQSIPLLMRAASYLPTHQRADETLWQLLGGDSEDHTTTHFQADFVAAYRDAYLMSKTYQDTAVMDAYNMQLSESEFGIDDATGAPMTPEQIMTAYNTYGIPDSERHPDYRQGA